MPFEGDVSTLSWRDPRDAEMANLATAAGIAYRDVLRLIAAGVAAGYLTQDARGALRLTAAGWRLHYWDRVHRRR